MLTGMRCVPRRTCPRRRSFEPRSFSLNIGKKWSLAWHQWWQIIRSPGVTDVAPDVMKDNIERHFHTLVDDVVIKEVDLEFALNKVIVVNNFLAHSYIAPESLNEVNPILPHKQDAEKGNTL